MKQEIISVNTSSKGLYEFTDQVRKIVNSSGTQIGLVNVFIKHTSASLIIQENADPSAKVDLEEFMERLAPENESWHTHVFEGPDDTTSHLKSSITQTSLNIPISDGVLNIGMWQGIYLWEHRNLPHNRKIVLTILS
ncbi:secondary thiamine-phosphate synthase enzyme YjbQ [bacterium]|nr:secondary thiamine-phosphate synthase enzyme YjbQ [bacterium]